MDDTCGRSKGKPPAPLGPTCREIVRHSGRRRQWTGGKGMPEDKNEFRSKVLKAIETLNAKIDKLSAEMAELRKDSTAGEDDEDDEDD